jgi:hypothetical protein
MSDEVEVEQLRAEVSRLGGELEKLAMLTMRLAVRLDRQQMYVINALGRTPGFRADIELAFKGRAFFTGRALEHLGEELRASLPPDDPMAAEIETAMRTLRESASDAEPREEGRLAEVIDLFPQRGRGRDHDE